MSKIIKPIKRKLRQRKLDLNEKVKIGTCLYEDLLMFVQETKNLTKERFLSKLAYPPNSKESLQRLDYFLRTGILHEYRAFDEKGNICNFISVGERGKKLLDNRFITRRKYLLLKAISEGIVNAEIKVLSTQF